MRTFNNIRGLIKFGFRLVPNQPWKKSSWHGAKEYVKFRNETFSGDPDKYPTLREALRFGGWIQQMDHYRRYHSNPFLDEWEKKENVSQVRRHS